MSNSAKGSSANDESISSASRKFPENLQNRRKCIVGKGEVIS